MPRLFNPIRAFVHLRVVVAGACVLTAAALAFVATASSNSPATATSKVVSNALSHDAISSAYEGTQKDGESISPTTAAEEEYAHRAYPGPDDIDLGALINAQAGLQNFMAHPTPTPQPDISPTPPDSTPTPSPTATPKGKKKKGGKKKGMSAPAVTAPTSTSGSSSLTSTDEPPPINFWQEVTGNTAADTGLLTFTGSNQNLSGRITALALDTHNGCTVGFCRVWVAAAGGGIWRTTNALATNPTWTNVSSSMGQFVTNAIGAMKYVDNGTANGILFVGTGEPNASVDSEAGVGLYKSTDGGDTWTLLNAQIGPITTINPGIGPNGTYTGNAFLGRSISGIATTNGTTLYVSSARGVRGYSSVPGGATANPTTPRPPVGVFKSTDGGNTFSYVMDGDPSCGAGTCLGGGAFSSIRGAVEVKIDPNNSSIIYSSFFPGPAGGGGVFRSNDAGATWTQIKAPLNSTNVDRCTFALNTGGSVGGNTRMYVGCGNAGTNTAQVFRSDLVQTGVPVFTNLTSLEVVPSTAGYCTAQCWYDNVVESPAGFPDTVYVGGSYTYGECGAGSDCRGVVAAFDAGASGFWNDMTWDAQNNVTPAGRCCQPNPIAPNGMHPDQHALIFVPGSNTLFFEGNDGGIVRSDGNITNISGQCGSTRVASGAITTLAQLLQCDVLLGGFGGGVPNFLDTSMNSGLRTLQLQSVAIANNNSSHFQFGTQDNGTFDGTGTFVNFNSVIFGDGGNGGFASTNSNLRVNTFTGQQSAVSFQNGSPTTWDLATLPMLLSPESALFYPPVVPDPAAGAPQTIFHGDNHVWRTQDWGGPQAFLDANCNVFGNVLLTCGDFVPLGGTAGANDQGCLTCSFWGGRAGGNVGFIARTTANTSTMWASTSTGRLFITENANAAAGSVTYSRLDNGGASGDPGRFITGIAIDPANPRHAYVTYSGYNFNTPSQTGHVFSVTWSGAGPATFTKIDANIWDIPLTAVAYDPVTGDVFVGSDFLVFRLDANPATNPVQQWFLAGLNMPMVNTAGLTIIPGSRLLYAATHGRGVWKLTLP